MCFNSSFSSQVQDVEFAQVQIQVADGLKQGNEALKKMHEVCKKKQEKLKVSVKPYFKSQWVTCGLTDH